MKKVLILGGSHRDIPLINASKKLGFYVITLGNKDYYLGHQYSHKALKINFNDLEKVREIIVSENIDYLLPGCGEESYLNTVKLAKEFNIGNFDDLETALIVHNKWKFKDACLKSGVSTPKGFLYKKESNINELNFPIVVKPTNLSGGRGVEVVDNLKDLNTALNSAKKLSSDIFLEEYIEGKLIAYSIFLVNKKIVYGFVAEDRTYLNKYLITTAYPYDIDDKLLQNIKNDLEKLSQDLNLVDGMFHLQILIKDNKYYVIDVTRRIPGDLFPYLMEYNDNVKYSQAVVNSYTTGKITDEFSSYKKSDELVIRHCVMPSKNGTYEGLKIDEKLKDKIIYRLDLQDSGFQIEDFLNTQLAIIFVKVNKSCIDITYRLESLITPIINEQ